MSCAVDHAKAAGWFEQAAAKAKRKTKADGATKDRLKRAPQTNVLGAIHPCNGRLGRDRARAPRTLHQKRPLQNVWLLFVACLVVAFGGTAFAQNAQLRAAPPVAPAAQSRPVKVARPAVQPVAPAMQARPAPVAARPAAPTVAPSVQPSPAAPVAQLSGIPPQYTPSATVLSSGGHKDAYVAAGDPNAVVRVLQARVLQDPNKGNIHILDEEHQQLRTLAQHGIPVVRVIAKGQVDGRPADVVERYTLSNKDAAFNTPEGRRILASSIGDLTRIRDVLARDGISVGDIQLLFKEGHAVISDPLGVTVNPVAASYSVAFHAYPVA
jgi:hypothetical protein